jgi:hypothetical protein
VTGAEALQAVRRHFESLFPRTCPNCGRRFATLREYILTTTRVGMAMSLDAEEGDWGTTQPIGSLALANCPCGTTLSLSTQGMAQPPRLELLSWLRMETQRTGVSSSGLLETLRNDLRKQVLGEQAPSDTQGV